MSLRVESSPDHHAETLQAPIEAVDLDEHGHMMILTRVSVVKAEKGVIYKIPIDVMIRYLRGD